MPLKKQEVHARVDGGMSDNVDDFHIPTQGNELVENGIFYKDGVIRKRYGNAEVTALPTTPTTDPFALFSIDDKLYTISGDQVFAYDGTQWDTIQNAALPNAKVTSLISTQGAVGLKNHDIYVDSTYVAVVWEQRTAAQDTVKVVWKVYRRSGVLLYEGEVADASNPCVGLGNPNELLVVYHVQSSGAEPVSSIRIDLTTGIVGSTIAHVADVEKNRNLLPAADVNIDAVLFAANSYLRPEGLNSDSSYKCDLGTDQIIATTDATTGDLGLVKLSNSMQTLDFSASITAGAGEIVWPLAVAQDQTNSLVYLLYAVHTISTLAGRNADGHDVFLRSYDFTGTPVGTLARASFTPVAAAYDNAPAASVTELCGISTNGSIAVDPTTQEVVAIHSSFIATDTDGIGTSAAGLIPQVNWVTLDAFTTGSASVNALGVTIGQRLGSKVVWKDSQPFGVFEVSSPEVNFRNFKTAKLCRISEDTADQRLFPVATTGALDSAQVDDVEHLSNSSLPNLLVENDTIFVADRKLETFGDTQQISSLSTLKLFSHPEARIKVFDVTFDSGQPAAINVGNGGLSLAMGMPVWFDGGTLAEMTHLDPPIITSLVGVQGIAPFNDQRLFNGIFPGDTIGTIDGGTVVGTDGGEHGFSVVIAYEDELGLVHRSVPSRPRYTDIEDHTDVKVYFTPPLSAMPSSRSKYFAEVYVVSPIDGTFKLGVTKELTLADFGTQANTYARVRIGDIDFSGGGIFTYRQLASQILYTDGGTFASEPPPPFETAVSTGRRVYAISDNEPSVVFYSKEFEPGVAPEFNGSLTLNFGDGRKISALGTLDDKLVVFEKNKIHVVYGEGPNGTGTAGAFQVHKVASDVGCIVPQSVIELPVGLLFQSQRGIHLLDRALNVQYIGGGVEDVLVGATVVAATLVADQSEVRFLTQVTGSPLSVIGGNFIKSSRPPIPTYGNTNDFSTAIVFNYERNRWSVFRNYAGVAATVYQDRYTRIRSDWSIWQESRTSWADPSGDNLLAITTPWYKFDGLQGFSRVYHMNVLGRYMSEFLADGSGDLDAGDLQVELSFNYVGAGAETQDKSLWKADDELFPLLDGTTILSQDAMQVRVRPRIGKLQSMQVRLVEKETGTGFRVGRGFEISGLSFEVGVKQGLFRNINQKRHE